MRLPVMLLATFLGAIVAGCAGVDGGDGLPPIPPDPGPSSARQQARPLGSTSAPSGFLEYLPPGYDAGGRWPLLVFLHGIGENGDGTTALANVARNGPPKLIARDAWPPERRMVVLSPQHVGSGCPTAAEVDAFLAWAVDAYRIDPRKVLLTGLSCGAIGGWGYLGQHRGERVAAALLIAGDPGPVASSWSAWGRSGCGLGEVAVWSLHGDADTVVGIGNDRDTLAQLQGCSAPAPRAAEWTEFPGAGHDVWTRVYDGSAVGDVYAWLLAHPKR
ncbi:MAG: hypothetical protein QM767_13085 [Anaeromyxobacter sp.]